MRRIATWVLVAAVVALGAAAGFDALRGGEPTRTEARPTTPSRAESTTRPDSPEAALAAALREAGIGGILEFSDEDCETHAVSLPDLTARPSGVGAACTFEVTGRADGRRLVTAPTAAYENLGTLRLSPSGGFVVARIVDPGGVVVVDRDGALIRPLVRHGSALAWSPDERWIAEATEEGVYVFPANGSTPRVYVLPIAGDLVWR